MQTILFIHGTGVREPAYSHSFSLVEEAIHQRFGPAVNVARCYWGGTCGTRLFRDGASIPEFDATRATTQEASDAEYEIALWNALYDDPAAELELLALRDPGSQLDLAEPAGAALDLRFRAIGSTNLGTGETAEELARRLERAHLLQYIDKAREAVVQTDAYAAVESASEPLTDYRLALARALIAAAVRVRYEEERSAAGDVSLGGDERDRIVELLVEQLGGTTRNPADWVKGRARSLLLGIGTRWFKTRRGRLSEQLAPVGADIVAYQTRPHAIREFIRAAVNEVSAAHADTEVVILAHSLGGIAAVDALIESPLPAVRRLITVGSQAPLLYELDSLASLPLPRGEDGNVSNARVEFPEHFPKKWLNIYDRRDFLSYLGARIFPDRVRDVEVDNREPFPESHGGYWTNDKVWETISAFLREAV